MKSPVGRFHAGRMDSTGCHWTGSSCQRLKSYQGTHGSRLTAVVHMADTTLHSPRQNNNDTLWTGITHCIVDGFQMAQCRYVALITLWYVIIDLFLCLGIPMPFVHFALRVWSLTPRRSVLCVESWKRETQLVERRIRDPKIEGSKPACIRSTRKMCEFFRFKKILCWLAVGVPNPPCVLARIIIITYAR